MLNYGGYVAKTAIGKQEGSSEELQVCAELQKSSKQTFREQNTQFTENETCSTLT